MNTGVISFLIIIGYLIFMLAITIVNNKKKKMEETAVGFFLAGRGVSAVLLPLTMIAAMQSTFAFLGAPGMYYTHGISYMVLILSQVWVAMMVIYFGNKIRKLSLRRGYLSIGDFFEDRFQSSYLKIIASIISVLMTMVFLSMQYVGNARALSIVTDGFISYQFAIIVAVVFSLLYVLIGGASGVVLLDAIQAVILMVGMVVAAFIALKPVGGVKALFETTAATMPELLSRPGPQGLYNDKYWVMQFIVLPFGIWLCPHIWNKSLMAKDERALARSAISIPVSQVIIYAFSALFIGLAGHILINPSELTAADNVLPLMMTKYSSWLVAAFVMAAAISAGTSTINAMLLVSSQIVSQDLVLFGRKDKVSDKQNIFISRIIVLIISIVCAIIALRPPETLVQVVQDVAYTGLAQLAPPFIAGLYWSKASKKGAAVGLTVGTVILFGTRILNITPLGWPGFMWAFFINIILLVVISLMENKNTLPEGFGNISKI
ncbi:sodium:solute symporter family protein [Anaerosphaera multitolerans]|uniref:Sodium:solute symporter family protein n=1 Tax=Anaerosphaera multitolerans TaxID=2487351 RepID=A0A437S5P9_9FIRM|nr:sodium:solute symporter family protein [Anaerosphaera multitolerans]RVU54297.1 sodium:solute symporter family protein [Anaerosphaera multitolerans]